MKGDRHFSIPIWLTASPVWVGTLYASIAAFATYCCMYAMRKPFTAAGYHDFEFWGVQYKIVLVISQAIGYALSKFIGIRLISSLTPERRIFWILSLLAVALLALLGFAVTPFPYNFIWMFINGLPLGMIWGLVFSFIEGRRTTDLMAAVLSTNFIISSGFVKSIGQWLMLDYAVSEFWMPFATGLLFVPLLLVAVWLLAQLPPPDKKDQAERQERKPMDNAQRKSLWNRYETGLVLLILVYFMLTITRDIRDNFAVEIWNDLGYSGQPAILTTAELPIALCALIGLGLLILIKHNFKAFAMYHWLTIIGGILLAGTTYCFFQHWISPVFWMISSGLALFVPYIIFNGMLFDRLLAAYKEPGNVGFLMYIADAVGYMGSVGVLFWKNFGFNQMGWLRFYTSLCYGCSIAMVVLGLGSLYFFYRKRFMNRPNTQTTAVELDKNKIFKKVINQSVIYGKQV